MNSIVNIFFKGLEVILFICIVTMLIMVFGNVVMRYGFNSGFTLSDEISRFCFFWVIFLGAIIASREQSHLSVDTVQQMLPKTARKICWGASQILILICCIYMFYGFYLQHDVFAEDVSPVCEMPLMFVYGVMYISTLGIGIISINNVIRLLLGKVKEDEYSMHKQVSKTECSEKH